MRLLPWEYGVRNLGRSPLRLGLSVGGAALVVLLVLAAGAFVRGMEKSLRVSGGSDNVILLGAGSEESFERSEIGPAVGSLVQAAVPGIKARAGVAYVSPEVHLMTELQEAPGGRPLPVLLRGVTPEALLVHTQVRVVEGRLPQPGEAEMMVGRLAGTRMDLSADRLAVGQTLWFDKRAWTIVGEFEAPGTVMESEVWCPLSQLQIAARRDNLSCVVLTLDPARGEFADVDLFCKTRLDLELVAMRERDYYAGLLAFFRPIRAMVWVTALLVATGGIMGGLNTMYAAFAARVRELGSLQAIGYSRTAIVVSLVQESLLAAAAGALLAAVAGVMLLDGLSVRFSMGAFGLVVDPPVVGMGLLAGVLLGVIGALPPAWRCLRMPITEALKAG